MVAQSTRGRLIGVRILSRRPSPVVPGGGVDRNKYEYFESWRSAGVNNARPSSADIPVSFGPPNVDMFPSTRKRISSTG